MYLPRSEQPSAGAAWLDAALALRREGGEASPLIVHITHPGEEEDIDMAVAAEIDALVAGSGSDEVYPVITVANTVFPERLYRRHGYPAFFGAYERLYDATIRRAGGWGRYFERLIRYPDGEGSVNQLPG